MEWAEFSLLTNLISKYLTNILPYARPAQECQKVFKASKPMDNDLVKGKVNGFGFQVLDGVDPKPDNLVGAGIVMCEGSQIGCLLRLEPSKAALVGILLRYCCIYCFFRDGR